MANFWNDVAVLVVVTIAGAVIGHHVSGAARNFVPASRPELPVRSRVEVPHMVVELALAAAFGALAVKFGPQWSLPAYLFFAAAGMLLSLIDLRHQLLPNVIVFRAGAAGAGLLAVAASFESGWESLVRAVAGGGLLFALYLFLALISPASLGLGDVKLAAVIGFFLAFEGWETLLTGTLAGFLLGGLVGLVVLTSRRGSRRTQIPFGPSMLVGAVLALAC